MPKGRPGGNPGLEQYKFQPIYDWGEPCNAKMTLCLPPWMKEAIKAGKIDDWHEVCRRAIAAELEKNSPEGEQKN